MIDGIDLHILKILQKKARIPNVEVARQVDMAPHLKIPQCLNIWPVMVL